MQTQTVDVITLEDMILEVIYEQTTAHMVNREEYGSSDIEVDLSSITCTRLEFAFLKLFDDEVDILPRLTEHQKKMIVRHINENA